MVFGGGTEKQHIYNFLTNVSIRKLHEMIYKIEMKGDVSSILSVMGFLFYFNQFLTFQTKCKLNRAKTFDQFAFINVRQ